MKALVLAGGRGKRLNHFTEGKNKCMTIIKGRPLIEYSLNNAVEADVEEIIIVVGYRAEDIINAYGNSYRGKNIKYCLQHEQRGLVHAIESAKHAVGDSDIMLMLADELMIKPKHRDMVTSFRRENAFGICGVVMIKDRELIKKTYSVIQAEDSRIYRLIEKPFKPMNDIMGTGNCIFKNEILSYIDQTPINQKRGEKELPDLIQCAVDEGNIIKSFEICDHYVNVNVPEEIEKAESYFAHL